MLFDLGKEGILFPGFFLEPISMFVMWNRNVRLSKWLKMSLGNIQSCMALFTLLRLLFTREGLPLFSR